MRLPEPNPFLYAADASAGNQYASVYFSRLVTLRKALTARLDAEHYPTRRAHSLLEAAQHPDQELVICGTIFKSMKLKHTVLKEFVDEKWTAPPRPAASYVTSSSDALHVEDETGRVSLSAPVAIVDSLITGVVAGLRGVLDGKTGLFHVDQVLPLGVTAAPERAPAPASARRRLVALASGLSFSSPTAGLAAQMAVGWLTGRLGGEADVALAADVCRVILAGNCVDSLENTVPVSGSAASASSSLKRQHLTFGDVPAVSTAALGACDLMLASLGLSVSVDLMPGPADPTNWLVPQQPVHLAMFPTACRLASVSSTTNPYSATIDGCTFLGSAGQPLDDLARYVAFGERIELLQRTLDWRHMAPTAPDTLHSFPFVAADPFIIQDVPHVYFAANQPAFATTVHCGVRLVLVPSFVTTHQIVLIDLLTLETRTVTFNTTALAAEQPAATAELDEPDASAAVPRMVMDGDDSGDDGD